MRKYAVVVLLGTLVSSAPLWAVDPEARKLAEQVLDLTKAEENLAQVRAQVGQMMAAQVGTMELPEGIEIPANTKERIGQLQQRILDEVFDAMSWEEMKGKYADVYADVFTREELQGLADFYRSPAGQAFADKTPLLTSRLMELAQTQVMELGPVIQSMTTEFMTELEQDAEEAGGVEDEP